MKLTGGIRWLAVAAGVIAVGIAVWIGARSINAHAIAAASVPPRPQAGRLPEPLLERMARAERNASGYLRAGAALAELSRLYHANGFFVEASQCYSGLLELEPKNPRWPHLLVAILAGFGRFEEALPLLGRTLELAPDYVPARIRYADVLLKTNQLAAADAAYADVLKRDAQNPYALLGMARCRIESNEWSAARELLRQSVSVHRDFFGGWALLATVCEHLGDNAEATDARRRAKSAQRFREAPDPWLDGLIEDCYDAYRLAVAAATTKDKPTAQRWLERAIALAPDAGSYYRQLGKLKFDSKDYAAARPLYERAVAIAPTDSDAWAYLIEIAMATHDLRGAEQALAQGLVNCPESPALRNLNGKRLRKAGRLDEAMVELRKGIELQPNEARSYIELAMVYFEQEKMDEGIAEMRAALAAEPGNVLAALVLARNAIQSDDEPAARHWMAHLRRQARVSDAEFGSIKQEFQQQFGRTVD